MLSVRRHLNPQTFVITLRQIAKHLGINPRRILNWEKWQHILWVHIEGRGGYFVSYRKLEQWIAACRTLIRRCRNLATLDALWSAILQEADRYAQTAITRLQSFYQQQVNTLFVKTSPNIDGC